MTMVSTENLSSSQSAVIEVSADQTSVCCKGGEGALGHPAVYLSMEGKTQVTCYYCGRVFRKSAG